MKICFEVRATALRPRLQHDEGFPLCLILLDRQYKFSLELFGYTCRLSRYRNTNLELTSSLEAATSTTSQFEEMMINTWPQTKLTCTILQPRWGDETLGIV